MNKPILTIGIPTYNSERTLRDCLCAITDQFTDTHVRDCVEVFVSDNASHDDTLRIIEEYREKFSNIRYSRNENNLEFDRNVDVILNNAKGAFCWTLSSNEIIRPGSIALLLAAIDLHDDAAFLCISNRKQDAHIAMRRFTNGDQWLKEMGLFGGQISQCVFNMRYMIHDRAKYFDNAWIHLSIFWEIAVNRSVVLLPCLFVFPDTDPACGWARNGGGGWALHTYVFLKHIVSDLPRYGYDQAVVDTVADGLAKGLPRTVASAKRYGLPIAWNRLFLMTKEFNRYPVYLLLSIGVFLIPSPLLRALKKMK